MDRALETITYIILILSNPVAPDTIQSDIGQWSMS